jgi:hypothetical protein
MYWSPDAWNAKVCGINLRRSIESASVFLKHGKTEAAADPESIEQEKGTQA